MATGAVKAPSKSLDFDDNPTSIDLIEDYLWLGNATAASDLQKLEELGITHILTIDSCPLPNFVTSHPRITSKYIQASDIPKEDLLHYFEDTIGFIDSAIRNEKSILVHCYYGVSRSATIVIAYIMHKHSISYERAFQRVKQRRVLVGPNSGFVSQLKLFHRMGHKIDKRNEKYKIYRLRMAADKIQKAKILPNSFMDLIRPDPAVIRESPEPLVLRCRKCRRILAERSNFLTHKSQDQVEQLGDQLRNNSIQSEHSGSAEGEAEAAAVCERAYFVEPIMWMTDILTHPQGRLNCPKCASKVGSFNWAMASRCPCGKQVSPAFYMMPSRVEKSNCVQNVQVTV